jgi:hypothetical protein
MFFQPDIIRNCVLQHTQSDGNARMHNFITSSVLARPRSTKDVALQ